MSMYEAKTAKKVYVYRNGVENADPKPLVVNDRQIRDFSSFLTRVTSGLKAPVAVRNIYTPSGGHRVHSLEDLQTGHYYVAGGNEHFRKIKWVELIIQALQVLCTLKAMRRALCLDSIYSCKTM